MMAFSVFALDRISFDIPLFAQKCKKHGPPIAFYFILWNIKILLYDSSSFVYSFIRGINSSNTISRICINILLV
jgi:hypothetical protein